jgi:hypothetical protein
VDDLLSKEVRVTLFVPLNSSQCSCNVIMLGAGGGGGYAACYWRSTYAVYDHASSIFMVVVRGTGT